MDTRTLCQLCVVLIILFDSITDAAWTLTGSSEFAVAAESFTLKCNPQDSNDVAVLWKRLDIDTTATGTNRAIVTSNGCSIDLGYDTQYQYTCEPGPVYKLTIPAHLMTNSQNNKVWRCESVFGGAGAEYKIKVHVPVSSISIQADNAVNQNVNVIYENIPKTFYCITNGCRPKANVTATTTGVTKGQLTESTTQNGDLIITRVSQVITANRGGSTTKTLQCSAVNIQGRQSVASQLVTFDVYYIPSVEPTLTGYTNGTVLYEGDKDLTVTCQQSSGYPLSIITWSCEGQRGTTNNGQTVASSYVQLTVNRNLNRKTCTCTVRHPDNNLAYTRTLSVVFTVYYPPSTPTLQTSDTSFPWVENTQGVLRCITAPGYPPQTTYDWLQNSQVVNGLTTDTYTIPTLTNVHNGLRIQCRVSNLYTRNRPPAKVSNITVLDVQYKPIISLSNRMVVVTEGQDVEIICSAIGNPTPIVNWQRENLPYGFGSNTFATLALEKATRNDTGIYNCKANARENNGNQSQIFKSEESIKIYVFYFTINKATPVCSSTESISFSCCSVINYSKPLKFYGWKHTMGNTTVQSLEGKLSTMNYNTLSIDYCGYYDSGIYTCEAAVDLHNNNTWYSFSSSIELVVTAPPVVSSKILDTDVNKKRKMSVKFYSVPKPDIVEWMKDGEKLTLSNEYQQITSVKNVTLLFYEKTVVVKGYESSMSIVNPVKSDFGTYTFRVQNSEGSAQIKLQMDSVSDNNYTGNETGLIVGGVTGFIAIISIILVAVYVFKRRQKRQNYESGNSSVSKDQFSVTKRESGNKEENNSYQDVDIQMYEELDATNKNNSQYDTLQEQRITCDTQQ